MASSFPSLLHFPTGAIRSPFAVGWTVSDLPDYTLRCILSDRTSVLQTSPLSSGLLAHCLEDTGCKKDPTEARSNRHNVLISNEDYPLLQNTQHTLTCSISDFDESSHLE